MATSETDSAKNRVADVIEVPRDLMSSIRRHGAKTYPEECCGVLIGTLGGDGSPAQVTKLLAAENQREEGARHNRFLIDPSVILKAQKTARQVGLEILGYYHSHPDHPAVPSDFDREHAWPDQSYIIVSVREGSPGDQRSWRLKDDRGGFEEETLRTT